MNLFSTILTQTLPFLPFALGISISFNLLRATDMTMDGSFVLGAAVFAHLGSLGYSPFLALSFTLLAGFGAGTLVALIQRGGKIEPLLAGVLATFILTSVNLIIMGKPNINLLSVHTLVSDAFMRDQKQGWMMIGVYVVISLVLVIVLLRSKFGLLLRAFGDNEPLLKKLGQQVELLRICGFGVTNTLAAFAGCLTAQAVGYADLNMGFGMTLTGVGAMILGQQLLRTLLPDTYFRIGLELCACALGTIFYFFALNSLYHLDVDPIYLKMILGLCLVFFLRTAKMRRVGMT